MPSTKRVRVSPSRLRMAVSMSIQLGFSCSVWSESSGPSMRVTTNGLDVSIIALWLCQVPIHNTVGCNHRQMLQPDLPGHALYGPVASACHAHILINIQNALFAFDGACKFLARVHCLLKDVGFRVGCADGVDHQRDVLAVCIDAKPVGITNDQFCQRALVPRGGARCRQAQVRSKSRQLFQSTSGQPKGFEGAEHLRRSGGEDTNIGCHHLHSKVGASRYHHTSVLFIRDEPVDVERRYYVCQYPEEDRMCG